MENLEEMGLMEDEFDSRSGSDHFEAASGDDQNTTENKSSMRKKYQRHTAFQIRELEAALKKNPHPDEKGRLELGRRLGLEGRQVKFWFQNRRTQVKTLLERHENSILKQEKDKLRIENIAMKEAIRSPICENYGSPAILGEIPLEHHHLMIENTRLKEELNHLGILASKFLNKTNEPMPTMMSCDPKLDLAVGRNGFGSLNMDPGLPLGHDFGNRMPNAFPMTMMSCEAPLDKSLFLELALAAMDELIKLAQMDSPLWLRSLEGNGESLNLEGYSMTFSPCVGVKSSHFDMAQERQGIGDNLDQADGSDFGREVAREGTVKERCGFPCGKRIS